MIIKVKNSAHLNSSMTTTLDNQKGDVFAEGAYLQKNAN